MIVKEAAPFEIELLISGFGHYGRKWVLNQYWWVFIQPSDKTTVGVINKQITLIFITVTS